MRVRTFLLLPIIFITCSTNERIPAVSSIPAPAGNNAAEPYLFADPSGTVFLSWIETRDTVYRLNYSQWNGQQWNEPVTLAKGSNWFVNWADYPVAVSDGKGNFLAHFLEKSSDEKFSYDIKITTSAGENIWTVPKVLHDDGLAAEHGFVYMVPYGEHVFISWLDGRNTVSEEKIDNGRHDHHGAMTVRAAVVTYQGEKLEEWELDNRACDCCQTTAAITTNGPVVIYRDRSEEEVRDIAIVRFVKGQWTTPQPIYSDNWHINGCPVNGPRCEALGNMLVVAWFTMADDEGRVNVIFSTDGGTSFGEPIRVDSGNAIGRVDVVLLNENTAVISWIEDSAIMARNISAEGKMGKTIRVAQASEASSSGFPQLTRTTDGIMMAWTDEESKTLKTARIAF